MSDDKPKERPPAKDKTVSVRVSPEDYDAARKRAGGLGRSLSDVLRSFIKVFGADEYPPPPDMPDENIRAQKRPRKAKKKRP